MKVTKSNARKVAASVRPFVDALLIAMAVAEVERERVDKIERKLLADEFDIRLSEKMGRRRRPSKGVTDEGRILDPKYVYLADLDSDVVKAYHDRLSEIHLAGGFADAADGKCPALVAEHTVVLAEGALIDKAAETFPEFDRGIYGDLRKRLLDLLIGLVVNSPGYKSPLKKAS